MSTVISQSGKYIVVQLEEGGKQFPFSKAFAEHLAVKDRAVQSELQNMIGEKGQEEEAVPQAPEPHPLQAEQRIKLFHPEPSKTAKSNVAFKCTFCDGGRSQKRIGYGGRLQRGHDAL